MNVFRNNVFVPFRTRKVEGVREIEFLWFIILVW